MLLFKRFDVLIPYWHAILHRREPDAFNAKYWFRRAGRHAIHPQLAQAAGLREWDAAAFVDRSESDRDAVELMNLIQLQHVEWKLLFEHCLRRAASNLARPSA